MWMEKLDNGKFKYIERYIDPMTEKYKKISITLTSDSRVAWNKAQRELNKRIDNKIETLHQSDLTFGEITYKWLVVHKNVVKPSTYLRSTQTLRIVKRYIKDDYIVRKITSVFIQETIESIYYVDNYSFSSTKQCKTLLNSILEFAKKKNIITINPVVDTEIKKKPKTFQQLEKIENKYLEPDELKSILNHLRSFSSGKRNADLTEFLSLTGLRFGEAIALKYDDFKGDFIDVNGTIDYHTNKSSEGVKTTTKTGKSTRRIDLSNRAIQIIENVIEQNKFLKREPYYQEKDFIFVSLYGNPLDISTYNTSIQRAAKKCGIKKHVSSHIFRHTHISILSELGVPLKAIMDRVGHVRPETTLGIYTHVTEKMQKGVIIKLNDYRI